MPWSVWVWQVFSAHLYGCEISLVIHPIARRGECGMSVSGVLYWIAIFGMVAIGGALVGFYA
jgi:hypothetical protein